MSSTEEELSTETEVQETTEADATAARTETETARPTRTDRTVTVEEETAIRERIVAPAEPPARSKQSLEREAIANEAAAEKATQAEDWAAAEAFWSNAAVCWEASKTAAAELAEPAAPTEERTR